VQGLRRAAGRVHEELCRTGVQDRVPDVSEILQKIRTTELRQLGRKYLIAALAIAIGGWVALDAGFVAAENLPKLSGAQIRTKFVGMQLTDEVHYRFVYERDGTLRSFAMGVKKRGKWVIDKDQLCLYLEEPDDGCYDVALSGKTFTLTPAGLGSPLDGIIEPISDPQ
jgi:hypothetical protein